MTYYSENLAVAVFVVMLSFKRSSLSTGEWEHWSKRVETYTYPSDSVPEFASILVPNVDNIRTNFLIETIVKQAKVCQTNLCFIFVDLGIIEVFLSYCIWKMLYKGIIKSIILYSILRVFFKGSHGS